jgi:predicted nucleic acid-binding protein
MSVTLPNFKSVPWLKIQAPKGLDKVPTAADLGAGEKEVLALGLQVPGAVAVLDDRLARSYADSLGLAYTGTLGVLVRAKAEGLISEVRPILAELERLGFRLSASARAAALKLAGESSA